MNAGDKLAQIAETQIGTRGDISSGRAALYGYLMATDANLSAFDPEWARRGFGESASSRFRLLNPGGAAAQPNSRIRLLGPESGPPEPPVILRMHSWCAAFVDWCVMQLLLTSPHATALTLSRRPKTALAFGLLQWARSNGCAVADRKSGHPERGDIAVFTFSHTGIVVQSGKGGFYSVEGNTTPAAGGNQGYIVEKRWRASNLLKGFIRLPPRNQVGDFNISTTLSRTA
jgi:hypothetical protein